MEKKILVIMLNKKAGYSFDYTVSVQIYKICEQKKAIM